MGLRCERRWLTLADMRIAYSSVFLTALVAGASFWAASHILPAGPLLVLWKGAAVALLAVWVALAARTLAARWLAVVLGFAALGDVLLETSGMTIGGAAFLVSHLLATGLYWTNRRADRSGTGVAITLLLGIACAGYALSGQPGVLVYGLALGGMAATAWISRFPRCWVGAGALLFAASDLLIFARLGPLVDSIVPTLLVWPLYVAGQAMIAYGVVRTERGAVGWSRGR
jgi:uncharacterized membrane protein YhhN